MIKTAYGEFLSANQILYPNLFKRQGLKPKYDREYIWNLILDFLYYGFEIDAFTETEGGRWLPGAYLHALQETDSIEAWVGGDKANVTLWSLTHIHAIRVKDPAGHVIEWDNINGIRDDLSQSPGIFDVRRKNRVNQKKYLLSNTHHLILESDRSDEVEVEYSIESHGCPSNGWDEPGEAPEITIWRVMVTIGDRSLELYIHNPKLTAFYEELEQKVIEHVCESDYDYAGDEI